MTSNSAEELPYAIIYVSGEDDSVKNGDFSQVTQDERFINGVGWISSNYVTFQNNANTNYEARELKSIYVDANGHFLKLKINDNHKNPYNNMDQVGIMSITVFGYALEDSRDPPMEAVARKKPSADLESNVHRPPKEDDFVEDPSSQNRYADQIRKIIKILDAKLKDAVAEEQFSTAKNLKKAKEKLREVEPEIVRMYKEKAKAVSHEDYDKAHDANSNIVKLKEATYTDAEIYTILSYNEKVLVGMDPREGLNTYDNKPAVAHRKESNVEPLFPPVNDNPPKNFDDTYNVEKEKEKEKLPPISNLPNNLSAGSSTPPPAQIESQPVYAEEIDELPSQHSLEDGYKARGLIDIDVLDHEINGTLDEKDEITYGQAQHVFGNRIVVAILSKNWEHRQQGFKELQECLSNANFRSKGEALDMLTPATQLLNRGLRDKVFPVYKSALNCQKYVINDFITKQKIPKSGSNTVVDKACLTIINRTGDTVSDSRFKPTSQEFLIEATQTPDFIVKKAFVARILQPFKASGYPKIDVGHAEIAERLVHEHGVNQELGINANNGSQFAISCLSHTSGDVRDVGVRMLVHLYKSGDRKLIRSYLPKDNPRLRQKSQLYKNIFETFDDIDKKNVSTYHEVNGKPQPVQNNPPIARDSTFNSASDTQARPQTANGPSQPATMAAGTKSMIPRRNGTKDDMDTLDRTCVFCGEVNDNFDTETLDVHYMKYCPVLTRCKACKKVVEIQQLKMHLLKECQFKNRYRECSRCLKPLETPEWQQHQNSQSCKVVLQSRATGRCLLCDKDIVPNDDKGWRRHLIGSNGCSGNPRAGNGTAVQRTRSNSLGSVKRK